MDTEILHGRKKIMVCYYYSIKYPRSLVIYGTLISYIQCHNFLWSELFRTVELVRASLKVYF
jgi:hypothetical protein